MKAILNYCYNLLFRKMRKMIKGARPLLLNQDETVGDKSPVKRGNLVPVKI
jgi:hypothetical protein